MVSPAHNTKWIVLAAFFLASSVAQAGTPRLRTPSNPLEQHAEEQYDLKMMTMKKKMMVSTSPYSFHQYPPGVATDERTTMENNVQISPPTTTSDGTIIEEEIEFPFKHHGVHFTRTVSQFMDKEKGAKAQMTLKDGATHCKQHDEYGDNDCKYKWSETMELNVETSLGEDLDGTTVVEGEFKIDLVAHLNFKCAVCGQPCTIEIPKINQHIEMEMPPCPIAAHDFKDTFIQVLPGPELIPPVLADGHLRLVKADGTKLVEVEVKIRVLA